MRFQSKSCFHKNVDGATTSTQEDPSPNPTLWANHANFPFGRTARSVSLAFQERLKRRNHQHLSEEQQQEQPTAQEKTALEPEERKKNRPSFSTAFRRIFRTKSQTESRASTVCADSEAEDDDEDDDENYCYSNRSQAAFDNPSTVAMKFMASRLHRSMTDDSGSRAKSHSVSSQLMHNRCTNCNKSYLRGLSRSSHFCTKDCKSSWTLRTGESAPAMLPM